MRTWITRPSSREIRFVKVGNPYHDPHDGRFTSADGAGGGAGSGASDPAGNAARYRETIGGKSSAATRAASMPDGKNYEGTTPMTDEQYAQDRQFVEKQLTLAGADDLLHSSTSTHISQDYVAGQMGHYNDGRRALQNQIRDDYRTQMESVPSERRAIILGGLMGAGKTTMLHANAQSSGSVAGRLGIEYAHYDAQGNGVGEPSNFLVLSADTVKGKMDALGMDVKVPGLSPAESETFIHEESSYITQRIANEAIHQGKNVIWDISLPRAHAGIKRTNALRDQGYHVTGVFVDVSVGQSIKGSEKRHRDGTDQYNQGIGTGGRWVPLVNIEAQKDPTGKYRSRNRAAFEEMRGNGQFDHTVTVDNEGFARKIVEEHGREAPGKPRPRAQLRDAMGAVLKVGDRVRHSVASTDTTITGTVESVPGHGDEAGGKLGVYWIGEGEGKRSTHQAKHLVKIASASDQPAPTHGEMIGGGGNRGLYAGGNEIHMAFAAAL